MSLPETNSPRILIVDDEEIVLVALRETLARAGYQVTALPSAVAALEVINQIQFSVVISDQLMPRMNGLEFLSLVKEKQPDASRILITALLSCETVIDAINKGEIFRFIIKPWLREELLATVKNAVHRYDLIRRNTALQAETQAVNERLSELNRSLEAQVARVAEQNVALERLNAAMADNLAKSVHLCVQTMQTFYPTLGSQARRTNEICRMMGVGLNLSPEDSETLSVAAWLHDIGLVGVPRQIIKKWQDGLPLEPAEEQLVQHHPVLGEELASFSDRLSTVGRLIRSHHERYDGTGYPDRLQGDEIPWLARLLAVAVYFASSRHEEHLVVEQIKLNSGSFFDPDAVRAFLRALPKTVLPKREREVLLAELRPGMVLASGIYTANGILLIPEGQQLSAPYIDKLLNHNRISPISQSLIVYC